MNLTERVKELALANNLDYVGIAPAQSLQNEPDGHRPNDYLPGAQTVISIGIKLTMGTQLANKRFHGHSAPHHIINSYMWHGFGQLSLHFVDRTSQLITRLLEKEGYLGVPLMSASTFDIRSSIAEFSHIHAAVAAGLGELGWGDLVLTPEGGPKARYGSVITNARLEPDPIYNGPRLCNPEKCREAGNGTPVCARVCPTAAVGPGEHTVAIGKAKTKVAKVDPWKCTWGSMGLCKAAGGLADIPMPKKPGPDDIFNAMGKRDPFQNMEVGVIHRGDYCGKCVMECPVGASRTMSKILREVK